MDRWDIAQVDNKLDFVAKVLYDLYHIDGQLKSEDYLKISEAFHKIQSIKLDALYSLLEEPETKELA